MLKKFQIKLKREFVIVTLFLIAINVVLELYYLLFLSEQFNYLGFKFDFSLIKYIEIKLLLLAFIYFSYNTFNRSKFVFSIYILLMLFFFIPNAIIYAFMDHIRGPIYSVVLFLSLFMVIAPLKFKLKTIATSINFKYIFLSILTLVLLTPIIIIFKNDFNLNTLFLKDIYETREIFSDKISGLANYFYNWDVKIVIPVILAFLLIHKKYVLAAISFAVLIYLFIISGNKAVYMTSFVTIFFIFIGGDSYIKKIKLLLFFLILALIAIPIIDIYILNDYLLRGTFVMRVFFFPALLNYCYFDFFANAPLYFAENHFFNLFFTSPYALRSEYLISIKYFNTDEMYANNGIITDGYKNLGYTGVFLLSSLFAVIFMFFNSIKIDAKYFGIFFIFVFFFLSTPMLTVIITGGLWILMLFATVVMKKTNN